MATTCDCFAEFLNFNPTVKRHLLKIPWSLTSGYAERARQNIQYLPSFSHFFHLSHSLRFYDSLMLSLYFSQNTSMLFSSNYTPYGLKKTCSEAYAQAYFMLNTVNCCSPPFSKLQEGIVILHLAIA